MEPRDLEDELNLEEYGATLEPCLKMILKTEDLFVIASGAGKMEVGPNSLYRVIPNPARPPEIDGEKVKWYHQYRDRYIDDRYKGVGPKVGILF